MTYNTRSTQFASPGRDSKKNIEDIFEKLNAAPYIHDLMDALPFIIFILNANRQIVYSNRTLLETLDVKDMRDLLGLRPGEVFQCIHANTNAAGCGTSESCRVCGAVLAVLQSQAKNIRTEHEAKIAATIKGELVSFDLSVSATPFDFGNQRYTIVSLTDISHEKRRRALERIFFHDSLNTAGNIHNLADMISLVEPDKRDEFLNLIYIASRQLVEEIKTQKILFEAETDEFVVNIEPVRSKEVLALIIELFNKQELVRDIKMNIQACDIEFQTDTILLSRVLSNMIKNALEASEQGETVTIGCKEEDGHIQFFVHNETCIPEDFQLQMFQRSFSTKGSGRGLGLYSIKLLTEKYLSGKVSFESTDKKGTTFKAIFPLTLKNG